MTEAPASAASRSGLPITVAQAPALLRQVWQRSRLLRRTPARQPLFRLCYFSCHSYFAYLYCALHSLVGSAHGTRFEVLVFNDQDLPISAAQIEALQQLVPGLRVISWPKAMGWGHEQIGWIWKAYALAAEGLQADDVVARIDSDVFFFNDRIFRAVERSPADLIGDGHFVDFQYCQGGSYFLKASAVQQVLGLIAQHGVPTLLADVAVVVEDVALMHMARRLGLKVWMTWFMMFPDELRNAGRLNAWQRFKFSCLHFVYKNKAGMLDAYRREVLPAAQQAGFDAVLKTA